jgi:hypothetical protein
MKEKRADLIINQLVDWLVDDCETKMAERFIIDRNDSLFLKSCGIFSLESQKKEKENE